MTEFVDAIATLADTFGPVTLMPKTTPAAQPDEIGPCVVCGRPTRRYGPAGHATCHTCDQRTPPIVAELLPLGECGCGHQILIKEEGEPCPNCLDDDLDPHDCPAETSP